LRPGSRLDVAAGTQTFHKVPVTQDELGEEVARLKHQVEELREQLATVSARTSSASSLKRDVAAAGTLLRPARCCGRHVATGAGSAAVGSLWPEG
jgi:ribosomal protein L29